MRIVFYLSILCSVWSCKRIDVFIQDKKTSTKPNLKHELADSKKNTICDFQTYVEYKDSLPLFSEPYGNIIKYFRFEDDPEYDFGGGFLFKNARLGWLQIGADEFNLDLEGLWIESEYIKVGTTNYKNQLIPLHVKPNKDSSVSGYLGKESYLNVLNCSQDWAYVHNGKVQGWLSPEFICNNPETNCN